MQLNSRIIDQIGCVNEQNIEVFWIYAIFLQLVC